MLRQELEQTWAKIYGASLDTIEALAQKIKRRWKDRRSERFVCRANNWWKYIDIEANREAIGRYGLSIDDVNNVVEAAIGGMTLTTTKETAFFCKCQICTRV
jgi:Cu(I)/Ag(I) efflux system membrane protein CusA/SilA